MVYDNYGRWSSGRDNTANNSIFKGSAPRRRPPVVLQSDSGGEEATKKLLAGSRSRTCSVRALGADDRQMALGGSMRIHNFD